RFITLLLITPGPMGSGLSVRAAWTRLPRLQLEEAARVLAENVAFRLFAQEWQSRHLSRHVEVPVRPVRGVEQLRLRVNRLERRLEQLVVGALHRLRRVIHLLDV